MNLIVFTMHYPYGSSENFLEQEMKVAEKMFDNIVIVTYAKITETANKYIPKNAKVICIRKKNDVVKNYLIAVKFIFLPRVWKELYFGCKERGYRAVIDVLKQILLFERHIAYLQRNDFNWDNQVFSFKKTIYYSYWLDSAALYLARNKDRIKGAHIARAHGGDCFFSRGYVPWRIRILNDLDKIFPISESGRLDILEHYGKIIANLSDKVNVSRLGVDLPNFVKKNFCSKNQVVLVSCSNVIQLKRLDLLIDALSLCDFIDIYWIHFGDGILMEQIQTYAKQKLIKNDRIKYKFYGWVTKETILNYYKTNKIDIFVNCSDVEGIPVSAMEAMSYGIPVIARNVGGNAELIDQKCGILLPEKVTPKELAMAIKTILYNEDGVLYQLRSNFAFNRIKEFYSADLNYNSFFKIIKRMITENV